MQIAKYEEQIRSMKDQIVQLELRPSPPAITIPPSPSSSKTPCSECVLGQQRLANITKQLQDVSEKYESARDGGK